MPAPAAAAPRAPAPGLLVLLGAMTAFGAMSIDMYLPALPTMGRALGAAPGAVGLTVSAFILGMGAGQFLWGSWSDRAGRRRPVLAGIALYVAASAACALAPTVELLTAARFAQGLGGSAALVIARALVRDRWDTGQSARIFSYLTLVMGVAPVLAPLAGAALLPLGWRPIFWALALFGAVVGAACLLALPETRRPADRARARAEHPAATYARLLGSRRLWGYLVAGGASSGALFAYVTGSPLLFIDGFKLSPDAFARLFGLNALGFVGAAQLNRWALRRAAPERVAALTLLAGLLTAAAFTAAALAGAGAWLTAAFVFAVLAGFGLQQPNLTAGARAGGAPRAGAGSALSGAASFGLGAAVAALSGHLADGTPVPLAAVILACYLAACAAFFWGRGARPAPAHA